MIADDARPRSPTVVGGDGRRRRRDRRRPAPAFRRQPRRPSPGGLFVASSGEQVDGHDYAAGAVEARRRRRARHAAPTGVPTVVVADAVAALGRAGPARRSTGARPDGRSRSPARRARPAPRTTSPRCSPASARRSPPPATSTTSSACRSPCCAADADDRATSSSRWAPAASATSPTCAEIAPPDVAAVLNVGTAHIGEFGSREAIAAGQGRARRGAAADGAAVLNADDALVAAMADADRRPGAHLRRAAADVRWRDVELDDLGRPSFALGHAGESARGRGSRQPGAHQVVNAAAAAAMAARGGVAARRRSAERCARPRPPRRWRMELHERADGLVVVNDAYNANPASMRAALDALAAHRAAAGRRTVAVLGEMLELGDEPRPSTPRGRAATPPSSASTSSSSSARPPRGIADGARRRAGWRGARGRRRRAVTRRWPGCARMLRPATSCW